MKKFVFFVGLFAFNAHAVVSHKLITFSDATELLSTTKAMQTLATGTSLKLIKESERKSTRQGIEASYLEVETKFKGRRITGLVWKGDLPLTTFDLPGKDILMVAPVKFELINNIPKWTGEARVLQGKKVLASVQFEMLSSVLEPSPQYLYDARLKVLKDRPFSASTVALGLHQSYSACDFPTGDTLFIWDGKKLYLGPTVQVTNSADYAIDNSYKYFWKTNCLQVQYTRAPKEGEVGKPEVNDVFQAWDGSKFTKAEKCPLGI